jgi:hypothetical protein
VYTLNVVLTWGTEILSVKGCIVLLDIPNLFMEQKFTQGLVECSQELIPLCQAISAKEGTLFPLWIP